MLNPAFKSRITTRLVIARPDEGAAVAISADQERTAVQPSTSRRSAFQKSDLVIAAIALVSAAAILFRLLSVEHGPCRCYSCT